MTAAAKPPRKATKAAKKPAKRAPAKRAPRKPASVKDIDVSDVRPIGEVAGDKPPGPVLVDGSDAVLEQIATFSAHGPRVSTTEWGDLVLTMKVDKAQKYQAMPVTDHPETQLIVQVFAPMRRQQRGQEA